MIVRRLAPEDRDSLEAFLGAHADSSLFLRSNLHAVGIVDRGEPMHATYVGAFDDGELRGVAAHCWNGNVLLQAPMHLEAVVGLAVDVSGRDLTGFLGPWGQVCTARRAVAADRRARLESYEGLFAVDLEHLVRPPALDAAGMRCRATRSEDLDVIVAWRAAYEVEILGAVAGAEHEERVRADVERQHRAGSLWLLEQGMPVATSAFNARLPDVVQIGGVYTRPALRGRGYARAVVAGSLATVVETGVTRAILFTGEDNPAAQRAYQAIGFRRVGDYGLVLF